MLASRSGPCSSSPPSREALPRSSTQETQVVLGNAKAGHAASLASLALWRQDPLPQQGTRDGGADIFFLSVVEVDGALTVVACCCVVAEQPGGFGAGGVRERAIEEE